MCLCVYFSIYVDWGAKLDSVGLAHLMVTEDKYDRVRFQGSRVPENNRSGLDSSSARGVEGENI